MSLTLDEAARRTWPVLVVGAGPAGATAARELARRGVEVLLVDRATFPRWKVCGCCLNGNALATLERAGLGDLPRQHTAVPLREMHLAANRRTAQFSLTGSLALSREKLDAALVTEAIRAGASFLPGTSATLADRTSTARVVNLSNRDGNVRVAARVLLAADGLGGALLARAGENEAPPENKARIGAGVVCAGAPDFYRTGVLYMTCNRGGYLGLVRLEDGRLDLAAAFDAACVRREGGLGGAASKLLGEAGWPVPFECQSANWRGTPALTRKAHRVAAERVFVLGDSAGYVEPFTGEGMAWAFASGVAVAPLVIRAVTAWKDDLNREWTSRYRQVVSRRQLACRAAAALLRYPTLAGAVVTLLSCMPALAGPFVRHLNRSSVP